MRFVPSIVLGLMSIINIARGSIHAFAPDGGAHSIAGLDLSNNGATVLSLFAIIGLQQIVLGFFEAATVLRFRQFTTLLLALQSAITAADIINLYAWRELPVTVPGQPFNVVLFVVQFVALCIALMPRAAEKR